MGYASENYSVRGKIQIREPRPPAVVQSVPHDRPRSSRWKKKTEGENHQQEQQVWERKRTMMFIERQKRIRERREREEKKEPAVIGGAYKIALGRRGNSPAQGARQQRRRDRC